MRGYDRETESSCLLVVRFSHACNPTLLDGWCGIRCDCDAARRRLLISLLPVPPAHPSGHQRTALARAKSLRPRSVGDTHRR